MLHSRLPSDAFTPRQAERLAELLNGAGLFHSAWRPKDLERCTPRSLCSQYMRDPRAGTLRALIEAALDDD